MNEKKNIRLTLAYDGSRYSGWQRQKADFTIQAVLEEKIGMMLEEPVTLLASGRTDAGVHALKQVCNFVTHSTLDPEDIQRGLNSLLPADIFVRRAGISTIIYVACGSEAEVRRDAGLRRMAQGGTRFHLLQVLPEREHQPHQKDDEI
jgi:tRNA pseudouridine38-40 synthase